MTTGNPEFSKQDPAPPLQSETALPAEALEPSPQTITVTLELPVKVMAAIQQRIHQTGQAPSQIVAAALYQLWGLESDSEENPAPVRWEHLKQLSDRLSALEKLPKQVAALEQKVRLLTQSPSFQPPQPQPPAPPAPPAQTAQQALRPLRANQPEAGQDVQPAQLRTQGTSSTASSPPLEQPLEQCPQCDRSLGPPLKSSGRQVCAQCGWSNKPRVAHAFPGTELPSDELQRLLSQAASESLQNMKPRKKQEEPPKPKPPFPFLEG